MDGHGAVDERVASFRQAEDGGTTVTPWLGPGEEITICQPRN